MNLTRYEQETIVNYNAGEQTATLYTRDKAVMRKLDALVADFPGTYSLTSYVSYRKPRAVSAEQRERARVRMTQINSTDNSHKKEKNTYHVE